MDLDSDIKSLGYPAVRRAFNDVLQLCVEKLTKAELKLAEEILGLAVPGEASSDAVEMLADTALYSKKGAGGARAETRRAIDRIVPKLPLKRDPLKAAIAVRLPAAIFSVFVIERPHERGGVVARDLLDDGRAIHIMDQALAAQSAVQGEFPIAGRFVDLGPWHVGFGIVLPLRKSETLAIRLALSDGGDIETACGTLHELLYPVHLHGDDLVMAALEPVITALALSIDADVIDMDDLVAGLGSLVPGKPVRKRMVPAR